VSVTETETAVGRRTAVQESRLEQLARMVEIRRVEENVQTLYNDGHIRGSTHLANGQEAVSVGIAVAARLTDTVTCTYRGHGTALALGVTPEGVLGEICGRSIGCIGGVGGSMHLGDMSVGLLPTFAIVGAGVPVAAGAALTAWVRGTDDAAIAIFGDGSTNIGAFHEALNLAGILKLPVVFVCENNLYGEYTRINLSTPVDDLASRATSYGMPGQAVDGQDLDEVIGAVGSALDRARAGDGPTLLEMKTYRYSGHSRADAGTYRPDGELDAWKQRDPIDLFRARLVEGGEATDEQLADIDARVEQRVMAAVEAVLASPPPDIDEMLRHVTAAAS
jgi:acetoin:2,6-dichlorophenolindophenol oxidoreductase subunit alpha